MFAVGSHGLVCVLLCLITCTGVNAGQVSLLVTFSHVCFADGVGTVMTARFRLPAGRTYDVGALEEARERQHAQVVCNVLLLDNTVQIFRVNVSTHTFNLSY